MVERNAETHFGNRFEQTNSERITDHTTVCMIVRGTGRERTIKTQPVCLKTSNKRLLHARTFWRYCAKRASPSVLVPGLDLGVGQVELGRQFHAVLHAQVLLPFETLLQRLQLMVGERRPRFPLFLAEIRTGIPAVVVSVTCTHTETHKLISQKKKKPYGFSVSTPGTSLDGVWRDTDIQPIPPTC